MLITVQWDCELRSPTTYSLQKEHILFSFLLSCKVPWGTQDLISQKKMVKDKQNSEWWLRILGFANLITLGWILITLLPPPQNVERYVLPINFIDLEDGLGSSEHNSRHRSKCRSRVEYLGTKLVSTRFEQVTWIEKPKPGPWHNFISLQNETKD